MLLTVTLVLTVASLHGFQQTWGQQGELATWQGSQGTQFKSLFTWPLLSDTWRSHCRKPSICSCLVFTWTVIWHILPWGSIKNWTKKWTLLFVTKILKLPPRSCSCQLILFPAFVYNSLINSPLCEYVGCLHCFSVPSNIVKDVFALTLIIEVRYAPVFGLHWTQLQLWRGMLPCALS